MMVCLCKGVSDRTLRWHVQNGACTLREVMQACKAGTDCGTCVCQVREVIEQARAEMDQGDDAAQAEPRSASSQ